MYIKVSIQCDQLPLHISLPLSLSLSNCRLPFAFAALSPRIVGFSLGLSVYVFAAAAVIAAVIVVVAASLHHVIVSLARSPFSGTSCACLCPCVCVCGVAALKSFAAFCCRCRRCRRRRCRRAFRPRGWSLGLQTAAAAAGSNAAVCPKADLQFYMRQL